jgi:uncharacterized DUF497 family protein/predicted DNA binding CopG/RHH family protein
VDVQDWLAAATGFHWDAGNAEKNWRKHQVTPAECEQTFFNQPLVVTPDLVHSEAEVRYYALGRTDSSRLLLIIFSQREALTRVISARDMSGREERYTAEMDKREIPRFRSEEEEQAFWAEHDSSEYIDWSRAERVVLPNLKPSTRTISLRLPESMIEELKLLANKRDVPYQSLLKLFLAERIEQELRRGRKAS